MPHPAAPLVGAATPAVLRTVAAPANLVRRYGTEAALLAADPRRLEPIVPGLDISRAELEFAVTHEGALDVDDILDRRTRIGLVPGDRARALDAAGDVSA
ncbi:glycerol-3-phosphate dehydrogenase C-terminal domain-containing protein [Rhodococcus aetherivorans]